MQGANNRIVTKEKTSFTELLDDSEGIILDLENLHYYTLNASAVVLWKLMRKDDACTTQGLSLTLSKLFDIDHQKAQQDVGAFLAGLKENGLISLAETADEAQEAVIIPEEVKSFDYTPPSLSISESLKQVTLSGSSTVATAAISTGG